MTNPPASLRSLKTFGDVAAEDDAVLSYFLMTDAVGKISNNEKFMVLGRKGSGKTALVRHFAEGTSSLSRAINLRGYPWPLHAERKDNGASDVEAYVASWRYLIAVQFASLLLTRAESDTSNNSKAIRAFFKDNYGGTTPALSDVLRPNRLKLSKFSFEPQILGNKLGGVSLERKDSVFGRELDALTDSLLVAVKTLGARLKVPNLFLLFDELDQGLTTLDNSRKQMLIGLILAARAVRKTLSDSSVPMSPIIFLRTDLWEDLEFSDKNKITETHTLPLEWNSEELLKLVNARLTARLGSGSCWTNVADAALMRGAQTKWDHILARTFLRPRDVIAFLNSALAHAQKRQEDPLLFVNQDIVNAREQYSLYLKKELDDEIVPHWKYWDDALKACSALVTITFGKDQFVTEYAKRRSAENTVTSEKALELLYDFSVIGYERRSGYGGSSWTFQYVSPEAGWDAASTRFKVHLGLKEYAKLREERS